MRLSVSQKVTEAVIFNVFTLLVWSPVLLATGMSVSALPRDRIVNLVLSTAAVFCQEKLQRKRTPLPNRTLREQVLRPILGSGELFLLQALFYYPAVLLLDFSGPDIVVGLANLFAGSIGLWVWQEKFRWIALVWERGKTQVVPRIRGVHRFLSKVARRG
jgi:hypothetical protein